jgi:spermidine synthase
VQHPRRRRGSRHFRHKPSATCIGSGRKGAAQGDRREPPYSDLSDASDASAWSDRRPRSRATITFESLNAKKRIPPQPETALSIGLRRYLYATAATTGGAIMIVEILGAKMLSPYVGLSHFVWTAQIAVTLVALACGYYAGGRIADRWPKLGGLYCAILGAAVYLALTVLICEPVAYWCLDFRLAVGSLLASTFLFFIPLALLAMTGPFLVRVLTSSIAGVGGNVGRLTAISTLGSFVGTLLIGYVMVPLLPNSATMYITALALMLVCVLYFVFFRREAAPIVATALVLAVTAWPGVALQIHPPGPPHFDYVTELFHGNSHFGKLQVIEGTNHEWRYYLNDNLIQNTYDPATKQSESAFTYLLARLAQAYTTNIQDALCIGLGVGIVPREFVHLGARVDVVEINPAVVPVGVKYFDLDTNKLHITIDDGRHFLNRCRKKYDAVALDAFLGDSSPSHLLTREAFKAIQQVLKPGGVLTMNIFCTTNAGHDFFAASLSKTLNSVFPGVRMHGYNGGAIFFVATDHPSPQFVHPPDTTAIHPRAEGDTKTAFSELVQASPADGRVLTDNFNPLEFYDAKNREELRRHLARNAREM